MGYIEYIKPHILWWVIFCRQIIYNRVMQNMKHGGVTWYTSVAVIIFLTEYMIRKWKWLGEHILLMMESIERRNEKQCLHRRLLLDITFLPKSMVLRPHCAEALRHTVCDGWMCQRKKLCVCRHSLIRPLVTSPGWGKPCSPLFTRADRGGRWSCTYSDANGF